MPCGSAEEQVLAREGLDLYSLFAAPDASGYVSVCLIPLLCFYSVGAYDWLRHRGDAEAYPFLEENAGRVRRARAVLKGVGSGGVDNLASELAAAHDASVAAFRGSHRGVLAPLKRWIQPDLGVFYVGENLVGSTHVALRGFPFTPDEIRRLDSTGYFALGPILRGFSTELGSFIGGILGRVGEDRAPLTPCTSNIVASAEDHKADRFFRLVASSIGVESPTVAAAVVAIVANHNLLGIVVPNTLQTSLAFRMRFLTWFHSVVSLKKVAAHVKGGGSSRLGALLSDVMRQPGSRQVCKWKALRNSLAHYDHAMPAGFQGDVLDFTCRDRTGATLDEVDAQATEENRALSMAFRELVSRGRFGGARVPT